jgi:ANTAR domain
MTSKKSRRTRAARADEAAFGVGSQPAEAGSGASPYDAGGNRTRSETGGVPGSPAQVAAAVRKPENDAPHGLAEAAAPAPEEAVVRRTKDGWRVGSDDLPDLTCAMILADLLAAENGMTDGTATKPPAQPAAASETGRLRATVGQLEHALATRIRVEQAIGVLAERHRIKPRQAFEQLRDAARSRGRRVIDIAGDVVASASNPLLQLPEELSRPRSGPRRGARQPSGAQ